MGQQNSKAQDLSGLSEKENYFGFHNFGNTCYLNSVLQALYFCEPFRQQVLQYRASHLKATRKNTLLLHALGEVFWDIREHKQQNGVYQPRRFIAILQKQNELFRGNMHQDAHEFLNFLLNEVAEGLQREEKEKAAAEEDSAKEQGDRPASLTDSVSSSASNSSGSGTGKTFIQTIFEGLLVNETRCLCCENVTSRDESFLDLSIDIEQNSSVTHCLRNFSSVETLRGSDKFYCNSCRSLQEAEKRMRLKCIPPILIVHLKRFKYVEVNQRYTLAKLSHRVVFPLEIKLPNLSRESEHVDALYELFAVVVHLGSGPNHGHYICLIRSQGCWVQFDDDQFKKVDPLSMKAFFGGESEEAANRTCGYLLFYQRVAT